MSSTTPSTSTSTKSTLSIRYRRRWTLRIITICLQILLWSSSFIFISSIYLLAVSGSDGSILSTQILGLVSSLASLIYIATHMLIARSHISLPLFPLSHQRQPERRNTCYIALRLVVGLCALWILTVGWGLVVAARAPVCSFANPGTAENWKYGKRCVVERVGTGVGVLCLIASLYLFTTLTLIRRPFEASLFHHRPSHLSMSSTPSATPAMTSRVPSTAAFPPHRKPSFEAQHPHPRSLSLASGKTQTTCPTPSTPSASSPFPSALSLGLGISTILPIKPPPLHTHPLFRRSVSVSSAFSYTLPHPHSFTQQYPYTPYPYRVHSGLDALRLPLLHQRQQRGRSPSGPPPGLSLPALPAAAGSDSGSDSESAVSLDLVTELDVQAGAETTNDGKSERTGVDDAPVLPELRRVSEMRILEMFGGRGGDG